MICHYGLKWFMALWDTESFVGFMVFREQNIEEAVKLAFPNETDVANLNRWVISWIWLPQSMAKSRIRFRNFLAKSIIVRVCH